MEEQYEKIERYLAGTLSGPELAQFKNALKEDPNLAEEVKLHRNLQSFLGNQEKVSFIKNLESIGASLTPADFELPSDEKGPSTALAPKRNINPLWLIGIVGVAALVMYLTLFNRSKVPDLGEPINSLSEQSEVPQIPEALDSARSKEEPVLVPEEVKEADPIPVPPEQAPTQPKAERDPFLENPTIEQLFDPTKRSKVYDFDLSTTILKEVEPGKTALNIEGDLAAPKLDPKVRLLLECFNNDPTKYDHAPIFSGAIRPILIEEDQPIAFAAKKNYFIGYDTIANLKNGLYYYQIKLARDSSVLYGDRFRIE